MQFRSEELTVVYSIVHSHFEEQVHLQHTRYLEMEPNIRFLHRMAMINCGFDCNA